MLNHYDDHCFHDDDHIYYMYFKAANSHAHAKPYASPDNNNDDLFGNDRRLSDDSNINFLT